MRNLRLLFIMIALTALISSGLILSIQYTPPESYSKSILSNETTEELVGCTVITCSIGDTILYGYNLDGHNELDPFISFGNHIQFSDGTVIDFEEPICYTGRMLPTGPRDGYASFTLDGLCSAGNSLAVVPMFVDPVKENYTPQVDGPGIVGECDTVEEVTAFFNQYNYIRNDPPQWWWQYHFADALGNGTVVAVDDEGKVGFTNLNDSHYLVSTNHNLLDHSNYDGDLYESIARYDTACDMLDDITTEEELTVDAIRDVLDAVSADSTTHSLIMNPKTLDMYVYVPANYSKPITFNLQEEIDSLPEGEYNLYNITELYENWTPTVPLDNGDSSLQPVILVSGLGLGVVVVAIVLIRQKRQ